MRRYYIYNCLKTFFVDTFMFKYYVFRNKHIKFSKTIRTQLVISPLHIVIRYIRATTCVVVHRN